MRKKRDLSYKEWFMRSDIVDVINLKCPFVQTGFSPLGLLFGDTIGPESSEWIPPEQILFIISSHSIDSSALHHLVALYQLISFSFLRTWLTECYSWWSGRTETFLIFFHTSHRTEIYIFFVYYIGLRHFFFQLEFSKSVSLCYNCIVIKLD